MTIPVRFDPFYDGEGMHQRQLQPASPMAPAAPVNNEYRDVRTDPDQFHQLRGRSLVTGVIIPKSTMDGIPIGTEPHNTRVMKVTIDPHLQGQSAELHLGSVTPASLARAAAAANEAGIPLARDITSMRLRGAAMMHGVAAEEHDAQNGQPYQAPPQPQPVFRGPAMPNIPAPNLARVAQSTPQPAASQPRMTSPLRHFNQPAQRPPEAPVEREPRAIDLSRATLTTQGAPPRKRVIFEVEHFGQHSVSYHDVVIEADRNFIVLVYSKHYAGDMYVPPVGENPPKMAMSVEGDPYVYLVQTTGLHYSYGDCEFCILLIEQRLVPQPEDAQ